MLHGVLRQDKPFTTLEVRRPGEAMRRVRWHRLCVVMMVLCLSWATVTESARPTLRLGATGNDVRALQTRLSAWGYYSGPIDGVFGNSTYEAVRFFQRRNGLPIDGIVGRDTWILIGLWGEAATLSPIPLLARVVAAEAAGEPFMGMVAVAAVVLNRLKSPLFPKTMADVIYQPRAFQVVENGMIWRRIPDERTYQAVYAALNGEDPTDGALFFWNPSLVDRRNWVWSRQIVTRIGRHVFAI